MSGSVFHFAYAVNGLFFDSWDDEQAEKQKTSKKAVKMQIILFIVTSFYLKILNTELDSVQHSAFRKANILQILYLQSGYIADSVFRKANILQILYLQSEYITESVFAKWIYCRFCIS